MTSMITNLLASVAQSVPDAGSTGLLLGLGVLATGLIARYVKSRK